MIWALLPIGVALLLSATIHLALENRLLKKELRWTREANNKLLGVVGEHKCPK